MIKKQVTAVAIVLLIVAGIAYITLGSQTAKNKASAINSSSLQSSQPTYPAPQNSPNTIYNQTNSSSGNSTVLFNTSYLAPYTYLIYPGNISSQAKAAMSGFTMSANQLKNGSALITLTFIPLKANQTVLVKPGYKLYFIESSLSDDGFNGESSLSDDGYIIVSPSGYVV